jgi:DNA-binding NarL/FixJ family response regulator
MATERNRTKRAIRLAIADDHGLFRDGLRSVLWTRHGMLVVGETDRVDGIASMVERSRCDVLLLDLHMDRSCLAELAQMADHVSVIAISSSDDPREIAAVKAAGARGVVSKCLGASVLVEAIEAVADGKTWLPVEAPASTSQGEQPRRALLTPREREIVRLVAFGMRNAEVGRRLFISEKTVKAHLNNVFAKLGLRDRVALARYAIRSGLLAADELLPDPVPAACLKNPTLDL